jgi:nitrite reductase/ring-hydroxylating ferredoxin subunit
MKRIFYFLILFTVFFSCDRDTQTDNNNPYLPNYSFEVILNTSFPQYSSLAFPSNAVYVNSAGAGIRGLIVFNAGSGNFLAYDAACPNQPLTDCSTMTINAINAKCPCDDAEYSLFTGLAAGKQFPMKAYRVQMIDATTIKVYN